jgi:hypothetical protein
MRLFFHDSSDEIGAPTSFQTCVGAEDISLQHF